MDARRVYVTISGYRNIDYMPHVFFSDDGGTNWQDISGNLPEVPVNDIIIDPELAGTLYIANDLGVWYTENHGEYWELLGTDMPTTVVNDLVYHGESRTLTAATFGRSIFRYELGPASLVGDGPEINTFKAFPNPSNGLVQIQIPQQTGSIDLKVFDQSGKLITVRTEKDDAIIWLDLGDVVPGIYSVVISDDGQIIGKARITRI